MDENQPATDAKPQVEVWSANNSAVLAMAINAVKLIGLISAITGGLTIILCVLGYLVDYSHSYFLGLSIGIRNTQEYMGLGAVFLQDTAFTGILKGVVSVDCIWPAATFLLLLVLNRVFKGKTRAYNNVQDVILALVIANLAYIFYHLIRYFLWRGVLIYGLRDMPMKAALLSSDITALGTAYSNTACPLFLTLLIICYWYWGFVLKDHSNVSFFKTRALFKSALIILFMVNCYGVILSYGILMSRFEYPKVIACGMKDKEGNPFNSDQAIQLTFQLSDDNYFLMAESDKEYALYDFTARQMIYLRRDAVSFLRLGEEYNILQPAKELK